MILISRVGRSMGEASEVYKANCIIFSGVLVPVNMESDPPLLFKMYS